MALGIPAQGVVGGITVLTQLNPFVVALHFLLSMVLITLAVWLVRAAYRVNREPVRPVTAVVVTFTFVAMWVAVWLGTMTTGSGPHAGDLDSRRTGWDIVLIAHVHAFAVYAAIAGTVVRLWLARSRAVVLLLAVEVLQAAIGLTQYHLGLPIGLVAAAPARRRAEHRRGGEPPVLGPRPSAPSGSRPSRQQPGPLRGAVPAPDPGRRSRLCGSPGSTPSIAARSSAGPAGPASGGRPSDPARTDRRRRHRTRTPPPPAAGAAPPWAAPDGPPRTGRAADRTSAPSRARPASPARRRPARQLGLGFGDGGTGEQGDVRTVGARVLRPVLAGQARACRASHWPCDPPRYRSPAAARPTGPRPSRPADQKSSGSTAAATNTRAR